MRISGREALTGDRIAVPIVGGVFGRVEVIDAPGEVDGDGWISPAFWDIQVNGRWGVSFSSPDLTVEDVSRIARAQATLGTARFCPTLISAPSDHTRHGLRTIAAACEADPFVASTVLGIHLEGPYLSDREGFRGAHPVNSLRDPDWDEFRRWQDASGGRIVLITLAPERPGAISFLQRCVASGVVVAIGHSSADATVLRAAADAGATLSTHLGNGVASPMTRHPNPIFDQAAEDRFFASVIADGHHLDPATLRVLARSKTADRLILVSDASPLAGSPPGDYGPWSVLPSGKIVVAGSDYLAGSALGLEMGINRLGEATGWPLRTLMDSATRLPALLLKQPAPRIAEGEPASLVRFRLEPRFTIVETIVDGLRADR